MIGERNLSFEECLLAAARRRGRPAPGSRGRRRGMGEGGHPARAGGGRGGVEEVVAAPAGEVGLRRRTGGGQGGGGRGQAEVREDGARGERFAEEGDDAAPAAAAGAAQDVDREHALEEGGPVGGAGE